MSRGRRLAASLLFAFATPAHPALDPQLLTVLATGEGDAKSAAVNALVATGDPQAAVVLKSLADGELQVAGGRVLIVKGEDATDAATGAPVKPLPEAREDVVVNNRLRGEVEGAQAIV